MAPDVALTAAHGIGADSAWLHRAMPYSRFAEVARGALLATGLKEVDAAAVSTYTFRRFLPTIADVLALPQDWCQAIGNWQELPRAGAQDPTRSLEAMSQRYAGDKVVSAGEIKLRVVAAIASIPGDPTMAALREARFTVEALMGLADDRFTAGGTMWEPPRQSGAQLRLAVPQRKRKRPPHPPPPVACREVAEDVEPLLDADLDLEEDDMHELRVVQSEAAASSLPVLQLQASSSATSLPAGETEAGTIVGHAYDWLIQDPRGYGGGRLTAHLVACTDVDGRSLPYCRTAPFARQAASQGCGSAQLALAGASLRRTCAVRAPPEVADDARVACG
jgi:hypothetical protein